MTTVPRRPESRSRRDPKDIRPAREWVGGRFSPPVFIEEGDAPFRAELAIWIEVPPGLVVGMKLSKPDETTGALSALLRASMERPAAGPPRRPDRIRVSEDAMAAEVRAAIGDAIPIEIAPTPELDLVLRELVESMPGGDVVESYLEGGRIAAETVREMFKASELLYRLAPWKHAEDHQVLRMDIPALGVEGACISIIGALGQSRGVLVFPSLAGYEAFREVGEAAASGRRPLDLGTPWLSLCFDRKADVPPSMRREVQQHGWPVAGPDAYPRVTRHDSDGAARPLLEHDLEIAAACATSLSAFFVKHSQLFESGDGLPVCESYFDDDDLEVRFTAPYGALGLFDVGPGSRPQEPHRGVDSGHAKVGRNDPCPCGSGKKHKRCCMTVTEDAMAHAARRVRRTQDEVEPRLVRFLHSEVGTDAADRARDAFACGRDDLDRYGAIEQLFGPWLVYDWRERPGARSAADRFLDDPGARLAAGEKAFLRATVATPFSFHEVLEVERGRRLHVRDVLIGTEQQVFEQRGSETLQVGDLVFARVVLYEGVALMIGSGDIPLPPGDKLGVIRLRERIRNEHGTDPTREIVAARADELRAFYLELRDRLVNPRPRRMTNTDGDALEFHTITCDVDSAEEAFDALVPLARGTKRLELLREAEFDANSRLAKVEFPWLAKGSANRGATVLGHLVLERGRLKAEVNSARRAARLRKELNKRLGPKMRNLTVGIKPLAEAMEDLARTDTPEARRQRLEEEAARRSNPEVRSALRALAERQWDRWIDEHVPALDGLTPRDAVRKPEGREKVEALLLDFERKAARSEDEAYDFDRLRGKLGLPPRAAGPGPTA